MAVSQEELPTKELRDLARKMKRGYTLERTSGNHFRVRNAQGELVQWKGKNLRVTSSVRNPGTVEADFKGAGVLRGTQKPSRRMTPNQREHSRRGIEAMQATQRAQTRERREQSIELRSRMQPWLKAIGADTPGVMWDLARYLHQTSNGAYSSVESAHSALKNVQEGQGIKEETRAPIDELSQRFETEPEPLMLYVEIAREARGIEPIPATGKEWPFTMKLVDIAACFADKYQRPVKERIVRDRVLHFDERKVGAIQVSAREDRFAILDGQTRWRACEVIGKKRIWAAVFEGMTVADEARFFYEVNHDRLAVHQYYGFQARVLSGEAKAVEINRIVENAGFRVSPNTDWQKGGIAAVTALERAYDQPSDVREDPLTPALERMSRWKGMKNSTGAELIRGFGRFYAAFSDEEIDEEHLGELLDSFGPAPVLARSRDMAERAGRLKHIGSASSGVHLAKALVEIHNTGKPRGERLDVDRIPY